jgi:hypothetical protein
LIEEEEIWGGDDGSTDGFDRRESQEWEQPLPEDFMGSRETSV